MGQYKPDQDFTKGAKKLHPNEHGPFKYTHEYPDGDYPAPPPFVRHIYINFDTDSLGPLSVLAPDSLAIVTNNPPPGKTKSLRGNLFKENTNPDPLTGKPRNASPASLNINSATGGASRNWDVVVLKYLMRFDDADNKGYHADSGQVITATPKLSYISDTRTNSETQVAIYPTMAPVTGITALYRNGGSGRPDPTPLWPNASIYCKALNCGFAYDGQWNAVKIKVDRANNTIDFFINGVKVLGNSLYTNGAYPIADDFTFDAYRFFFAGSTFDQSVDRGGIAGGFQLAEIEVFEGDPDA